MPDPPVLAFDSSVLSPSARARRLSLLELLTAGHRRVATRAVLDELERGEREHPSLADVRSLAWLETVTTDGLRELVAFSQYIRILGSGGRDVGEASVLAWAEVHGAVVLIDDQTAVNAARDRGVTVKRSLALVARGCQTAVLSPEEARTLIDDLVAVGARLPCDGATFERWAEQHGLLVTKT